MRKKHDVNVNNNNNNMVKWVNVIKDKDFDRSSAFYILKSFISLLSKKNVQQ